MPLDPYANPPNTPYVGGYQWVPPATHGIGGSTPGSAFRSLRLIRGKFRNDLLKRKSVSGDIGEVIVPSIQTSDTVQVLSPAGSEEWPILNAFRPLARPSAGRGPAPDLPFIVEGANMYWLMQITSALASISSMTIFYELTADIFDPRILEIITDDTDRLAIQAYLDNPDSAPFPNIEWPKYPAAKLLASTDGSAQPTWVDWGLDADKLPIQLVLTGFHQGPNRSAPVKFTQRFNKSGSSGNLTSDYSTQQQFRIENRYGLESLRLKLNKVMLFNASRSNIDDSQVPCSLLEYAFLVQFDFDATLGTVRWPDSFNTPNFHVKFFAPDYRAESPGFAHSLSLRFSIFSMPIIGIAPGDFTNILGALDALNNPGAYWVVFIGPVPGTKTIRYVPSSSIAFRYPGNLIRLNQSAIYDGTRSIKVQGVLTTESTPPSDGASWADLVTHTLSDAFDIVDTDGFVQPYIYHHVAGTTKWWYRLVQVNQSGAQTFGLGFRGDAYIEKSTLQMFESADSSTVSPITITREPSLDLANALNAKPVAIFFGEPAGDLFVASPVDITQGDWRIRMKARVIDDSDQLSTHLIARFWFIPENEPDNITAAKLLEYRNQTEFYFQPNTDAASKTQLVFGKPNSLDQLLVSSPLSSDWEVVEAARYIESLSGSSSMRLSFDFGPNVRARLVVGIYAVAIPALESSGPPSAIDPLAPTYQLDFDPNVCLIETSLLQHLSYTLNVQQASRYDGSYFKALPAPLNAVTKYAGGADGHGDATYTKYEGHVTFSTDGQPVGAFTGLFTLRNETESKFYIAYPTNIPLTQDEAKTTSGYKYFDFVSDVSSLAGGRVLPGAYQATATIDVGHDFDLLEIMLRFELLLVQTDGTVVERIFKTSFITRDNDTYSSPSNFNITIPFLIRNQDVQLVLRTYVHPYSKTGDPVSVDDIATALGPNIPVGLRFNALRLQSHQVQELVLRQTDSFPGSPAFYEQLPLVPSKTIGGQEFWYIAAEENLQPIIAVPPDSQFVSITGTMYSPVWFVDLPEDIEVQVSAPSLGPTDLWIRTVPSTGTTTSTESGISAFEDQTSRAEHIVRSHTPDGSTETTIEVTSTNDPFSTSYAQNDVASSRGALSDANYPNVIGYASSGIGPNDSLLLTYQREKNDAPEQNATLSYKENQQYAWGAPDILSSGTDFTDNRRMARGMRYANLTTQTNGSTCFICGWVDPGGLVVREVWPYDCTPSTSQAESINYLVDGDPNTDMGFGQNIILPSAPLTGKVVQTGSGLAIISTGMMCAYVVEGESGLIFFRRSRYGLGFGAAQVGVSFRAEGVTASSTLDCRGITLSTAISSSTVICAFWCGGKIMVAPINFASNGNVLAPIQLVAGSTDLSTSTNLSHEAFRSLRDIGILQTSRIGSDELDVPQQRPGLIVSSQVNAADQAVVYYEDNDGKLCSRVVKIGHITYDKVIL